MNVCGVVDVDDCARAFGTTATAARCVFDVMCVMSECVSDDLDDDVSV